MMPDPALLYGLAGSGLFALGLAGALLQRQLLARLLALNVGGAGVFMALIALGYRGPGTPPDPLPHALVLTGIVVAVSATALALALGRRLRQTGGQSGP
jgi:multicomponent Na+:H+ antiporter subunit C